MYWYIESQFGIALIGIKWQTYNMYHATQDKLCLYLDNKDAC